MLPLFNPLNGGKIVYFPKLYDLSDWLFALQCVVLISFVFCFRGFSVFGGVRSLWLEVLVMWESNLSASQFACCAFYNVKFLILCSFSVVVAPNYFREPLRLVLLVVISVFIGFCLFRAGTCFALILISTGLGSCSLWRNKVVSWPDLVGHEFWVWSSLGASTVSLKFRQFKSAVCDAF